MLWTEAVMQIPASVAWLRWVFVEAHGLLIVVASLVVEHGL